MEHILEKRMIGGKSLVELKVNGGFPAVCRKAPLSIIPDSIKGVKVTPATCTSNCPFFVKVEGGFQLECMDRPLFIKDK